MKINAVKPNLMQACQFSKTNFFKTPQIGYDVVSFGNVEEKPVFYKESKPLEVALKETAKDREEGNTINLLRYYGFNPKKTDGKNIKINGYRQPSKSFTFKDALIDEKKIFEIVTSIKGDAKFAKSQIEDLGKVCFIEGNVDFSNSKVKTLGKLKIIEGDANFAFSCIKHTQGISKIGGSAYFGCSQVENLAMLKEVGKDVDMTGNYSMRTLGGLEKIGGNLYLTGSGVRSIKSLKQVGGNIYISEKQESSILKSIKEPSLKEKIIVEKENDCEDD